MYLYGKTGQDFWAMRAISYLSNTIGELLTMNSTFEKSHVRDVPVQHRQVSSSLVMFTHKIWHKVWFLEFLEKLRLLNAGNDTRKDKTLKNHVLVSKSGCLKKGLTVVWEKVLRVVKVLEDDFVKTKIISGKETGKLERN